MYSCSARRLNRLRGVDLALDGVDHVGVNVPAVACRALLLGSTLRLA
jgi:hypothetical protein